MHVVCTDLLCVLCIGLLSAEFSTVNTGMGRPMFWKPVSVEWSLASGYYNHNLHRLLKFSTQM